MALSSARIRAQLRAPLVDLLRLYFSFGEWIRSSSRAKPIRSESMPSLLRKDSTIGIEAPHPTITGFLPIQLRAHAQRPERQALACPRRASRLHERKTR